ncbi:MAG: hypothetical protein JJE04_18040 [Acidobacteriia bacterium]|nr:hypothetical protein [Terriglobia bacterium]
MEQQFQDSLTNATLVGKFTSKSNDRLAEDRYDISKVTRMPGGIWLIHTRVRYGSHDVTVPIPVKVVWAGDTPMITLTDLTIPGLGTFTARVLFYRDQYAGTWSSAKGHGGQMFGRVERGKP